MAQESDAQADEAPVAIVTGAGHGIGRSIAAGLHALGWRLALVGRRSRPLEELADELGADRAFALPADIADATQAEVIRDRVMARFGRIDALVNNAGLAVQRDIEDTGPELLGQLFAVNAIGPGALISAVWPVMRDRRSGVIVNVSTLGTSDPFPGFFGYAASKAALDVYAKSIATEGAEFGIRGFSVAPGAVETEMLRSMFDEDVIPPTATLHPNDVARLVIDCVLGNRDADSGRTIPISRPAPAATT